eukprot:TRINITY_DN4285_c0_g1_i3.p1 TRINITY_DN4285_c0_g1~~TRINITY_DN4285_c0_g1_i3.p1  ORF type:complete len:300 (-),score=30.96 TRINITY_DN4285_c0_g1_i3:61-960(-)
MNSPLRLFFLFLFCLCTFCEIFVSEEDGFLDLERRERNCAELCSKYEKDASYLSSSAEACVPSPELCPQLFDMKMIEKEDWFQKRSIRKRQTAVNLTTTEIAIFRAVTQPMLGNPSVALPVPTTNQWRIDCTTTPYILRGTIPTEFRQLTFLTLIELRNCFLSGTIPTEIGLLRNQVAISAARLTGTLPTELGNLLSLDFSYNQLTGTIPSELGRLSSNLLISNNLLTGTIPSELGRLSDQLDLTANSLEGTLPLVNPSRAGARPYWYASFNRLSGTIPSEFGRAMVLQLGHNNLTGEN